MRRWPLALLFGLWPWAATGFELQGHRGARGLAPENTLPAFARALAIGVSTLELDLGVTADGHLVVVHDRRLSPPIARGPNGAYVREPAPAIHALTLQELKQYDVGVLRPGSGYATAYPEQQPAPGTRIPTLDEVVALVRKSGNDVVGFNIETKIAPSAPDESPPPDRFAQALLDEVRRLGIAARTTVQSFDWRTLQAAQRIAPDISTAYLSSERSGFDTIRRGQPGASPWTAGFDVDDYGGSVPRMVHAAGGRIWSPDHRDLTPAALAEAHALGLPVIVWTVNRREDMTRLIETGVDGIISDRPDVLRAVMAERGMALPAATPVEP